MGTGWPGVVACAGAVAWDPSLPLVVQDDTERCVVLSTAKDLRLWALAGPKWWLARGPWHGILHFPLVVQDDTVCAEF